jgi:hypothetical protein
MKWLSDVAKLWPGARPSQGPQGWTRPHPFRRFAPTAARLSGAPSAPADRQEREVALRLLPIGLHGGELIVTDKGYSGRDFKATIAERFGALLLRPTRKDEPDKGPHLAPIHRIDLLDPQRPPRTGTPQRPHPPRPQSPHHHQSPRARRRRLAQPPARTPNPRVREPRHLTPTPPNQPSRGLIPRGPNAAGRWRRDGMDVDGAWRRGAGPLARASSFGNERAGARGAARYLTVTFDAMLDWVIGEDAKGSGPCHALYGRFHTP